MLANFSFFILIIFINISHNITVVILIKVTISFQTNSNTFPLRTKNKLLETKLAAEQPQSQLQYNFKLL